MLLQTPASISLEFISGSVFGTREIRAFCLLACSPQPPASSHAVPAGTLSLEKSIFLHHEHIYLRPSRADLYLYLQKLENSVTLATTQGLVSFSRLNVIESQRKHFFLFKDVQTVNKDRRQGPPEGRRRGLEGRGSGPPRGCLRSGCGAVSGAQALLGSGLCL